MSKIIHSANARILIVTSVEAEKQAVLRGLGDVKGFEVAVVGVGVISAAVNTAYLLASTEYDLVINAGIAGGFKGKADIESVVVSSELIAADLGAESKEGFLSLEELKLGSACVKVNETLYTSVTTALREKGQKVQSGPILTLSTVTGTRETAEKLERAVPNAVAEAMEGFGVAVAAQKRKIPILEIRTISNMVGPRDRNAWKIKEALATLEQASSVLREVFR
ncbi:futalosine hydrolase [Halalkalibacter alkalisediminis]|uniref:Futalosine hydrolase n=1 Tax=Halalkalibacter alkalisediminis TaxID=935616 RepID=A0ABV6NKV5_9BACI|nr:futalosine hydrolase [Halalkalibacter alkalisediminis]